MCKLYSLTRSQDEIRQLARAMRDTTGTLPPLPGIFPDTMAPVVRTADDRVRELATSAARVAVAIGNLGSAR